MSLWLLGEPSIRAIADRVILNEPFKSTRSLKYPGPSGIIINRKKQKQHKQEGVPLLFGIAANTEAKLPHKSKQEGYLDEQSKLGDELDVVVDGRSPLVIIKFMLGYPAA